MNIMDLLLFSRKSIYHKAFILKILNERKNETFQNYSQLLIAEISIKMNCIITIDDIKSNPDALSNKDYEIFDFFISKTHEYFE